MRGRAAEKFRKERRKELKAEMWTKIKAVNAAEKVATEAEEAKEADAADKRKKATDLQDEVDKIKSELGPYGAWNLDLGIISHSLSQSVKSVRQSRTVHPTIPM